MERLDSYARFFASRRSYEAGVGRLLDDDDLTAEEHRRYEALREELLELRQVALGQTPDSEPGSDQPESFWHFPDGHPIVLLCGELPEEERPASAHPRSFTYGELYSYADVDALIELYGHIRAQNPTSQVSFRTAANMRTEDSSQHLVLLGGVAWNNKVGRLAARLGLPVFQMLGPEGESDVFMSREGGERRLFEPVMTADGDELVEDVGLLVRATNPDNRGRTVTICNGVWSAGVFASVRVLTHAALRVENEEYLRSRFSDLANFGVLFRVNVNDGIVATPDLRIDKNRLYEWPE
ncbi:XRE family transcriptional regulator [Cryptosporangium minutisporangium]|uniref:XRE family transcriptional regulator n=1 Tax=Cryptosporangium minutisporangium TaxID=113569 RepID=UPI0031E6C2DB